MFSWVKKPKFWSYITQKYNLLKDSTKHNAGSSKSVTVTKDDYKFYDQEKEQNTYEDNTFDQNTVTNKNEIAVVDKKTSGDSSAKIKLNQDTNLTIEETKSTQELANQQFEVNDTQDQVTSLPNDPENQLQLKIQESQPSCDETYSQSPKEEDKSRAQSDTEENLIQTSDDNDNEKQNQPSEREDDKDEFSVKQEQNRIAQDQEEKKETNTSVDKVTEVLSATEKVEKEGPSLEQKQNATENIRESNANKPSKEENEAILMTPEETDKNDSTPKISEEDKPEAPKQEIYNVEDGSSVKQEQNRIAQDQEEKEETNTSVDKVSETEVLAATEKVEKEGPSLEQKQNATENIRESNANKPSKEENKAILVTPEKTDKNDSTPKISEEDKSGAPKQEIYNVKDGSSLEPEQNTNTQYQSIDQSQLNTEEKVIETSANNENETPNKPSKKETDKDGTTFEQEQNRTAQNQEEKEENNTSVDNVNETEVISATGKVEKEGPSLEQKQNATENTRESDVNKPSKEEKKVILVTPEETNKNVSTPKISEEDKPEAPKQEIHNVEDGPLKIFNIHQEYFSDNFDLKIIDTYDIPTKISTIKSYAETLHDKVHNFNEEMYSIEYFVLDEKLMQLVEKLDKIKCNSDENYTKKKIEAISYIAGLHSTLDANAKEES